MNDGGPAFATKTTVREVSDYQPMASVGQGCGTMQPAAQPTMVTHISTTGGISIRDYFAAKALQGLIAFPTALDDVRLYAERAYKFADAMLAARFK